MVGAACVGGCTVVKASAYWGLLCPSAPAMALAQRRCGVPKLLTKPANVLTLTLLILTLGTLFYVGATSMGFLRKVPSGVVPVSTPSRGQARAALSMVGLSPQYLAAAGLSESQATALVVNAKAYLSQHGDTFFGAADEVRARLIGCTTAASARSGAALAGQSPRQRWTPRTRLASATSAKATVIDGLIGAATEGLPRTAVATLATLRANRQKELPTKYLAANRTKAEWAALRDALANQRISARSGEPTDAGCQRLIAETDAQTAVASAASGLEKAAAIRTAWDAAVK